jgi:hypothetical protein
MSRRISILTNPPTILNRTLFFFSGASNEKPELAPQTHTSNVLRFFLSNNFLGHLDFLALRGAVEREATHGEDPEYPDVSNGRGGGVDLMYVGKMIWTANGFR